MYAKKLFIFAFSIFYSQVQTNAEYTSMNDDEGYYWRDYKAGDIPKDALSGGINQNGKITYIGQVLHRDLLIAAKIDPANGNVAYETENKEYITNINVKILCSRYPEKFQWLPTGNGLFQNIDPKLLVVGGYEPKSKMYIGRKQLNGELVLGKVTSTELQTTLNTSKDGVATQHSEFEVLSYNPNKKVNKTAIVNHNTSKDETCNYRVFIINFFN